MASITLGPLGQASGKLAHVVYFTKGDKTFFRQASSSKKSPSSDKQLETQAKFKLMQNFLGKVSRFVQKGYSSKKVKSSSYNEAFRVNVKQAFTGTLPNLELDYVKIQLTKGPLSAVSSLTVSNNAEDLTLNWFYSAADVKSNADDKICVLVYHPEKDLVLQYDRIASRSDKTATINLPPDFVGEEVLTWVSFENEIATQVSTSLFTRVTI